MYLAVALFLIIFEMSSEGFKARKWHVVSEWIEFVYRAVIVIVFFMWITRQTMHWLPYDPDHNVRLLIGYLLLRIGIGNIIWNMCAGEEVTYIGFTKSYDRLLRRALEKMHMPVQFYVWIEVVLAVTGMGMLFRIVI